MVTGSKQLMRNINTNIILEMIINNGKITRTDLSKNTGLTKATVSSIIQELIDKNLVYEVGTSSNDLGRKAINLSMCKDVGYAICVNIQPTVITIAFSNLRAEIVLEKKIENMKPTDDLATTIITEIEKAINQLPKCEYSIVGMTLSVSGITHDNNLIFSSSEKLNNSNICNKIVEHFNFPIFIENDANLSVLAENSLLYNSTNIASLNIYDGVGLGLMINNSILKGYRGSAGEIGHTIVKMNGRPCSCGNKGCLEQYLSQSKILENFANKKNKQHITFLEFMDYYNSNDTLALESIDIFTEFLTVALSNIINSYNPEIITINNDFVFSIDSIINKVIGLLSKYDNNYRLIIASKLKGKSALLGGLCMVIKNFYSIKYLHFPVKNNSIKYEI